MSVRRKNEKWRNSVELTTPLFSTPSFPGIPLHVCADDSSIGTQTLEERPVVPPLKRKKVSSPPSILSPPPSFLPLSSFSLSLLPRCSFGWRRAMRSASLSRASPFTNAQRTETQSPQNRFLPLSPSCGVVHRMTLTTKRLLQSTSRHAIMSTSTTTAGQKDVWQGKELGERKAQVVVQQKRLRPDQGHDPLPDQRRR